METLGSGAGSVKEGLEETGAKSVTGRRVDHVKTMENGGIATANAVDFTKKVSVGSSLNPPNNLFGLKQLKARIRWAFIKFSQHVFVGGVRVAERIVGPEMLRLLLGPAALWQARLRAGDYAQFRRLRGKMAEAFWKGEPAAGHFRRMFQDVTASFITTAISDRLANRQWRDRFTVRGTPPYLLPEWGAKPVVLVFLHTGTFGILRFWLRAQKVPAAVYSKGLPDSYERFEDVRRQGDRAYGLQGIPHVFGWEESARRAVRFLQAGRLLLISLEQRDFSKGRMIYNLRGTDICLDDGAFRIARMAGAVLMPLAARQSGLRYELTFGEPVPAAVVKAGNVRAANAHLLRELWRGVEADPTCLTWTSMEAVAPELIAPRGNWP